MIDTDVEVVAVFFRRWLTVEQMKQILDQLDDDDIVVPNRVGNLSVCDSEGGQTGYIDFAVERFEANE